MGHRSFLAAVLIGVTLLLPRSGHAATDHLYLIDAHSQATVETDLSTIVPLMDRGGVYRTILSRIPNPPATIDQMMSIAALAKEYPDRVVPAVSTKIGRTADYDAQLNGNAERLWKLPPKSP